MEDTQHKFERAGLGKAPFRIVGFEEKRGPISLGDGLTVGAPGQPMGSCHFCGTGITDCFTIESADGRRFIVGSTCVGKTGDEGLISTVKREVAKKRTEARHAREAEKIGVLKAKLADPVIRASLQTKAHPQAWRRDQGATLLDWAEWMMTHAGNSGKMAVGRRLREEGL